ncbi:serine/threonine-protein kinase pim-3-like [Antennarius striatus]|uniref:serine/threonine-protein kinase pim-3-like n=1 Tax=Antennarius striatus TaxID=241820 RepID=UPI0035B2315B
MEEVHQTTRTSVLQDRANDKTEDKQLPESAAGGTMSLPSSSSKGDFENKYLQLQMIMKGGFGCVYAGSRKSDDLPHINGKTYVVPTEVLIMNRVAGGEERMGKCAAVSLLDWYDLEDGFYLVMERPVPCVDLFTYTAIGLNEQEAKPPPAHHLLPAEKHLQRLTAVTQRLHRETEVLLHAPCHQGVIMKQLVAAANEIHSQGVFHRDIKMENVLVEIGSEAPRVRLIDFGSSVQVRAEPFQTLEGTTSFFPPEYFVMKAYRAGPTTVWQLGAVLYEMLDNTLEFSTYRFLLKPHKFREQIGRLKVSQDCQHFLRKCLTLDPQERSTLEELLVHPWIH